MNVQKRELLKRQLERQAKLFALEDDTEETVVSILATCSALLREAENALTEEMTAETFDNIYPGYIGISKRMNAFYVTNKSMFDKKETEMVAGIHAAFEEDMQKMIRNVENAKDSYAELSAYQTELKRIQDALREDGYVNVESFSNKLEAMNQQSEQLMKDYDRFLKMSVRMWQSCKIKSKPEERQGVYKAMKIQLHAKRDGITKLGPGTRFVVWTQGCPRSCPGCMTAASQQMNGGFSADTKQLAEEILQSGRHGLTISGGEPFLQAKALADLIQEVRKKTDLGVMIYTGFTLEELQEADNPDYNLLLEQCDLLVDGPYIDELNDSKNLRGSSNQRAIPLTDRYAEYAKQIGTKPAEIEMFYEEEKIRIVGVPPKNMFKKVKQIGF